MTPVDRDRVRRAGDPRLGWLLCAAGFALTLAVFWPGYMSFDSAYQWWQARHGEYSNIHPPAMTLLWRVTDRLWPGPGPMFALFAALFWIALGLVSQASRWSSAQRVALLLVAGLWPPLLALLAHVWKDVAVMVLFALAVALMALSLRRRRRVQPATPIASGAPAPISLPAASPMQQGKRLEHRASRTEAHGKNPLPPFHGGRCRQAEGGARNASAPLHALCALALVAACAMRHNAISALPPLLFWLAWSSLRAGTTRRALTAGALAVVATALAWALAHLPDRVPGMVRHDAWPAVAAWDVAAVSVLEQRVLVPGDLLFPGDALPRLTAHYTPATNVPTLTAGGVRSNFLFPYTQAQTDELRSLWLSLPWRHTRAYLAHRGAVAARLFGWHKDEQTRALALMPGEVAYRDNPPIATRDDAAHRRVQALLDRLVDTPLFSGWIYLAATPLLFLLALRRRDARGHLAAATLASGACYALPLLVITGSAEFRYLSWLLMATVLAVLLIVHPREEAVE